MKKLLLDILHDAAVVCLLGLALDLALFTVFFGIFWLASGLVLLKALLCVRSAMMVTGALALLICAGLLLFSPKTDLRSKPQWRNRFRRFDLFPVVLGAAIFLLALAVGLDALLFALG